MDVDDRAAPQVLRDLGRLAPALRGQHPARLPPVDLALRVRDVAVAHEVEAGRRQTGTDSPSAVNRTRRSRTEEPVATASARP
jgi:hypothetical protein